MLKKIFIVCLVCLFFNCKNQEKRDAKIDNTKVFKSRQNFKNQCQIPIEVENYLEKNSDKWSKIELTDIDKQFSAFMLDYQKQSNNQICPYTVLSDFTNDNKEDFGIIVKNNYCKKKNDKYFNFPFLLLIFNNYKENINPIIVISKYLNNEDNTVIYSDEESGLLSYIKNGNTCGANVIDIIYFEKSSFFLHWDKEKENYKFSNYLDENLCDDIQKEAQNILKIGEWSNNCGYRLTMFDVSETNKVLMSLYSDNSIFINCILNKDLIKKDTYELFFNSLSSQEYYYNDKKNIIEEEISKEVSIARVTIIDNKTIALDWKGLYNIKTKERDFFDDFIFKKESNNDNHIILKKCD